ncbi:MAG: zinc ribbon domain-containing protein [Thermoplasmata archaeon]
MEPPEAQTIRSMLHVARILAIILGILVLIGGLIYVAAIAYFASVCSTFVGYDPYCGSAIAAALVPAIYLVILGVVAIFVYMQMRSIEAKVNARQFEAAKSQTLIWMILGFIFGIILGVLLLIAYLKFDPLITWQRGQAGGAMGYGVPPMAAAPGMAYPPSAGAPPAAGQRFCSSCGSPNAPGAQFCAKCGAAMPP